MTNEYFLDTYTIMELYKGNPNYEKCEEGIKILLNKLNILEFIYFLIREGKDNEVGESFKLLSNFNIEYNNEILLNAAKIKRGK